MDREEFERIKEAEKAHLRSLKKLKQAARTLERQQRLTRAVEDLATGADDVLATHRDAVDQLAMETARTEARLEMALEEAGAEDEARAARLAEADEELQRLRAQELVRQMKVQMGEADAAPADRPAPAQTDPAPPSPEADAKRPPSTAPEDLPEKTIGRMRS